MSSTSRIDFNGSPRVVLPVAAPSSTLNAMVLSRHDSLRRGTSIINEWKHRRAAFRLHLYRSWSSWWSENPQLGAAQYLRSLIADCRERFKYNSCCDIASSASLRPGRYPPSFLSCITAAGLNQPVGSRKRERQGRIHSQVLRLPSQSNTAPFATSQLSPSPRRARRSPVQHTLTVATFSLTCMTRRTLPRRFFRASRSQNDGRGHDTLHGPTRMSLRKRLRRSSSLSDDRSESESKASFSTSSALPQSDAE